MIFLKINIFYSKYCHSEISSTMSLAQSTTSPPLGLAPFRYFSCSCINLAFRPKSVVLNTIILLFSLDDDFSLRFVDDEEEETREIGIEGESGFVLSRTKFSPCVSSCSCCRC